MEADGARPPESSDASPSDIAAAETATPLSDEAAEGKGSRRRMARAKSDPATPPSRRGKSGQRDAPLAPEALPLDAPDSDKPKRKGRRSNNAPPEFAQPDRPKD